MTTRRGFTLLEAAVAMTIVSMVSVGALAAFGADMRAAQRAQEILPASALAEERLAVMELTEPAKLAVLPDSIARGRFEAPFERYEWTATAKPVRGERSLVELSVRIHWEGGEYAMARRRFRPPPVGPR